MKTSYSIGEFSQITGLSAKTLRFYHERGILVPTSVDQATGYRFYDAGKIEKARVIMRLGASGQFGPVAVAAEGLGAWFGKWDNDNFAILPPTGFSVSLDAGPVSGGGRPLLPRRADDGRGRPAARLCAGHCLLAAVLGAAAVAGSPRGGWCRG